MQDFLGSVRRSMVFRTTADEDNRENHPPLSGALADKITSCIRKSRVFIKPYSLSPSPPPPASAEKRKAPSSAAVDTASTIRWRKGQLIGRGAFGTVYMGMNLDSGELLAVKQVKINVIEFKSFSALITHDSSDSALTVLTEQVLIAARCATKGKAQTHVQELEEEVKLLKNLSHPNIVRYLGTVREDETLNILLEFVSGGSISSLLEKFGAFPEPVVRTYTEQLLLGLEYLHNHGIMHRDIKGANILVDNKGCIKLADFGASKQVAELATISGAKSMKGTPYWMAPEVIRQTGHSFSADIWSVGCTVIEMVTGKAPWSQQYKEVAAIFHIGTTKAHPPIPESLSADAKDFLLKCLQEEPNLRPTASELLKHPFVTGKQRDFASAVLAASIMENSSTHPPSQLMKSSTMSTCDDAGDICNLGSLNCSLLSPEPSIQSDNLWQKNNNADEDEDDMCLIDCENFVTFDAEASHALEKKNDIEKGNLVVNSYDAMNDISDGFKCKFDGSPGNGEREYNMSVDVDQPSYSEEDDELTESKIKAFLDEKAAELKKLQTPLYEEFYNSLITSSPNYMDCNSNSNKREDTPCSFLKLPPKSRSPGRGPLGGSPPSRATDTSGISKSPGSNGSPVVSNMHNASDEAAQEGITLSEIERKWKEELNQELERKRREIMRQAGIGSSPRDRNLSRQREKSRFASPGK